MIEKLKALVEHLGHDHFDAIDDTAKALNAWIDLAPDIIAVLEVSESMTRLSWPHHVANPAPDPHYALARALEALNAKAAEVLD